MNLTIGSGDIKYLMMGTNTKGFQDLLRRFVSDEKATYNALCSPIDACRTGAILETRYLQILPENYYSQYKCICDEMDVFVCTIDFPRIEEGKVIDFEELKSIGLYDYIRFIEPIKDLPKNEYTPIIKKQFKDYYNQVQEQLLCSGLNCCTLTFLSVYSYIDEENFNRDIKENEFAKFIINRDEEVIKAIKNKGSIFQQIKNYFK